MASETASDIALPDTRVTRRVLLIWQNPDSRAFVKVGRLELLEGDRYVFRYLPQAASERSFAPLAQFPDLNGVYQSHVLPAFFANRVMSSSRPGYAGYLHRLGLQDPLRTPVELLVRTGAARATDTFHVVDDLSASGDGPIVSRFLASGIRHLPGATDRLHHVQPGQELQLRAEPDNPVNKRALIVDAGMGEPVGYVPDWLVEDVHGLRGVAEEVRVFAEQVSPDAEPHLRLLCRLEARGRSR